MNTFDIKGGAARSAFRLLEGLHANGVDSKMLVQFKSSDNSDVIAPNSKWAKGISLLRPTFDALPLRLYRGKKQTEFSTAYWPERLTKKVTSYAPDIIHLHWVCKFLRIESLQNFSKPIVWTLHDMWAFTGGCHYDEECGRYKEACGYCPQLESKRQHDLSHWIWKRKKRRWRNLNLTFVTPSKWLAECAKTSSLLKDYKVHVIPNGLDTNRFKPYDKKLAREIIGLPQERRLILFGALGVSSDERKGFQYLQPALEKFAITEWNKSVDLVVFGSSEPANSTDFALKTRYIGRLHDDVSIALLYTAADLFVAPSVQDNLPNTIMESLACGTPVVAFNVGGIPDMIEHQKNGYLAKAFDTDDLASGIEWVLENAKRAKILSIAARDKAVKEYTLEVQAKRYIDLYKEILNS